MSWTLMGTVGTLPTEQALLTDTSFNLSEVTLDLVNTWNFCLLCCNKNAAESYDSSDE